MPPPKPFFPPLASPTVQTPFVIEQATSYRSQYPEYHLKTPPINYSVKHYADLRNTFELSKTDDPSQHYQTSAMTITSPERRSELQKVRRPEPFPLDPHCRRVITSAFAFQTTNDEMMGKTIAAAQQRQQRGGVGDEEKKEAEAARKRRAERKNGTLQLGYVIEEAVAKKSRELPRATSQLEHALFDDVKGPEKSSSSWLSSTKRIVDKETMTSLAQLSAKGSGPRQTPFSFPDEIQMDHSVLGLGRNSETKYLADSKAVKEYWTSPHRSEQYGPSKPCVKLPSVQLSYKDTRESEDDDLLCDKCRVRRHKHKSFHCGDHDTKAVPSPQRVNYMRSMYQVTMDPANNSVGGPRSRSSFF